MTGFKIPYLRWWIVAMLFVASMLNYVDRLVLAQLKGPIQEDLGFSDTAYANITTAFLFAYGVAYLLSGRITDKLGTRASMVVYITWWSIANMLHAFARSTFSLGAFRVLLGLGEAGNYTVGPKVVSEWFPARERALAIGIYTLGAAIGATVAPPLINGLWKGFGWQAAFFVTGAAGLLWVLPWTWLYRKPEEHPRITEKERAIVLGDKAAAAEPVVGAQAAEGSEWGRWKAVLSRADIWGLTLGRLLTDPVWYFFLFWFVDYLRKARGLSQEQTQIVWVVFIAADVGTIAGGWLSGAFVKREATPTASRLRVMLVAALLLPLSPLIYAAPTLWVCLGLVMVVALAHQAWLTNLSALVVDNVPKPLVGTAFGVVACGSTFGGMVMSKVVGYLVTYYSYRPWFIAMAFLHPVAIVAVWAGLRAMRRREGRSVAVAVAIAEPATAG